MKWAQTTDGFIDIIRPKDAPVQPTWITDETCKILVHKWRAEEDAFMAGTQTVVNDNSQLTIRNWSGKNPVRVIPDRTLRIPKHYNVFDSEARTIIYTEKDVVSESQTEYVKIDFSDDILQKICTDLHAKNILSLVVEGGAKLLNSFIEAGLWDEARIFYGNKFFHDGIFAPRIRGTVVDEKLIGNARLVVFRNKVN